MKYLLFFLFSFILCEEKPTVYFTKTISPNAMVKMFEKLDVKLTGKVGLKVHSGEPNGPYFLRPDFLQPIYDHTKGTFLECNVAYNSERLTTEKHEQVLQDNGWKDNNRRFEIMDAEEDTAFELENYNILNITYAGKKLLDYDSCLLKQLSIGFGSTKGKTWIHTAGKSTDYNELFIKKASQENFTASMADAASVIDNYFRKKGGIAYVSVLANISIDCDCAGKKAKPPQIKDIGILASTDPVAIDQACLDMIKKTNETGTEAFLERVADRMGENTITSAVKLGMGKKEYKLVTVDIPDASIYLKMNLLLLLLFMFV